MVNYSFNDNNIKHKDKNNSLLLTEELNRVANVQRLIFVTTFHIMSFCTK